MTFKVKINGEFFRWEDVHNRLGYTEHPTIPMDFKSAASPTWGAKVGSGYWDNIESSFWRESEIGWFSLDDLLENFEVYPSQVISLYVKRGSLLSSAVKWEGSNEPLFLIKIDASSGWMSEEDLEIAGWEVVSEPGVYDLPGFNMETGENQTVMYGSESHLMKCDSVFSGEWVDVDRFYADQDVVAIKKLSYTMYYGDTPVVIYVDDCEEPEIFTENEISSSFETWSFE